METPKQKAIREAYGEDYERISKREYGIDNEGFSNFYEHGNETFLHGYEIFCGHTVEDIVKVRPLGLGEKLENLKNNNGWIRIESEKDLPDEPTECHVITIYPKFKQNIVVIGNHKLTGKLVIYDRKNGNHYTIKEITHYQPIIKPKPPIY